MLLCYLHELQWLLVQQEFQREACPGQHHTRLVPANDPQLAPGEADVVLIVNTYMYLRNRVAYMKILQRGVSEGGKVIIVDFKKKRTAIGPPPSHERIPVFQVEEELYEAGFTDVIVNDTSLDYQYIVIATKRTG